ncbi:MAG TPA: SMC-Scp complex subunit ScpB [Devosiaceae bacterium]|nr:SMC-Scp complex subunit ScpB [Devosiaceae bacterium]
MSVDPVSTPDEDLPGEFEARDLRVLEALLFAAAEPLAEAEFAPHLSEGADIGALMLTLREKYRAAGVNLVQRAGQWAFRTAEDLGYLLRRDQVDERPLSRAALEALAVIAYHQPVTRSEIEEIRGVGMSRGVLDVLMEAGWIRMRGRRRTVGRPVTYGTTDAFLDHFGLETTSDLPGLDELRGAGLLSSALPPGFQVPSPNGAALAEDEDPLDPDDPGDEAPPFDDDLDDGD